MYQTYWRSCASWHYPSIRNLSVLIPSSQPGWPSLSSSSQGNVNRGSAMFGHVASSSFLCYYDNYSCSLPLIQLPMNAANMNFSRGCFWKALICFPCIASHYTVCKQISMQRFPQDFSPIHFRNVPNMYASNQIGFCFGWKPLLPGHYIGALRWPKS